MISDVLAKAVTEVRDYQARMPDVYGEFGAELDNLVLIMDAARVCLDVSAERNGVGNILAAIRELPVDGVRQAVGSFYESVALERAVLRRNRP